jgi:glycosyltransferase involved in cell wall biosynthesis
MRIGFYFIPSEHITGHQNYVVNLLSALQKIKAIKVKKISNVKFLERIDVDVVHYPYGLGLTYRLPLNKLVITLHGCYTMLFPLGQIDLKSRLIQIFMHKLIARNRASMIITVSRAEKHNLIKFLKIPKDKIEVVYHGVSEKFKPIRLEKKFPLEEPFVLHVGNFHFQKNVSRILKAYDLIRKWGLRLKLVLVGSPWKIKDYYVTLDMVNRSKFSRDIVLTRYISHDNLPLVYNSADLYVHPSLHESFGLPILEAMACGIPVLTSNVYSMPEIAGDAAVFVNPYSTNQIAAAMYTLLTDSKLRREKSQKGLRRAKQFTWEKAAYATFKIYDKVIYG